MSRFLLTCQNKLQTVTILEVHCACLPSCWHGENLLLLPSLDKQAVHQCPRATPIMEITPFCPHSLCAETEQHEFWMVFSQITLSLLCNAAQSSRGVAGSTKKSHSMMQWSPGEQVKDTAASGSSGTHLTSMSLAHETLLQATH